MYEAPQFQHECKSCKFLGRYLYLADPNNYDLYVCPQGSVPTVIARYGNEPHEYMSGLSIAMFTMQDGTNPNYPLAVAMYRAMVEGYLRITATSTLQGRADWVACCKASNQLADLVCLMYHPNDEKARKTWPTATWAEIIATALGIQIPQPEEV